MKSSSLTCLENSKNKIGVDVKITLLLFFCYRKKKGGDSENIVFTREMNLRLERRDAGGERESRRKRMGIF